MDILPKDHHALISRHGLGQGILDSLCVCHFLHRGAASWVHRFRQQRFLDGTPYNQFDLVLQLGQCVRGDCETLTQSRNWIVDRPELCARGAPEHGRNLAQTRNAVGDRRALGARGRRSQRANPRLQFGERSACYAYEGIAKEVSFRSDASCSQKSGPSPPARAVDHLASRAPDNFHIRSVDLTTQHAETSRPLFQVTTGDRCRGSRNCDAIVSADEQDRQLPSSRQVHRLHQHALVHRGLAKERYRNLAWP
jgi:hypothetical protein